MIEHEFGEGLPVRGEGAAAVAEPKEARQQVVKAAWASVWPIRAASTAPDNLPQAKMGWLRLSWVV